MTRQHLKDIADLARRKGRRAQGRFLVEGVRSVEAAVDAGAPLVLVAATPEAMDTPRVAALIARAGCPVETVPARDLDRVADVRTSQGVLAVARSVVGEGPAGGSALVLDGVQDPGNVGALVRTAAWFGVESVIATESCADFESPKVVRAAMGGLWDVRLVRVADPVPVLDGLVSDSAAVWAADLSGTALADWRPSPGDSLVMGSEAHGLSPAVARWLGENGGLVHIPGAGARGVESLNVAVAGGILMSRWRA